MIDGCPRRWQAKAAQAQAGGQAGRQVGHFPSVDAITWVYSRCHPCDQWNLTSFPKVKLQEIFSVSRSRGSGLVQQPVQISAALRLRDLTLFVGHHSGACSSPAQSGGESATGHPPEKSMIAPVRNVPFMVARYRISSPISSGLARRPAGTTRSM